MTRSPWLTRRGVLRTGAIAAGVAGVGTRTGAAQDDESSPDDHCYYQVDFVAGDPIETLGVSDDAFYGRQNRLIQYAHADGDEVIERDTWINSLDPEIRRCVSAEPISVFHGTASVEFTVADDREHRFSLTVYPLPDGEFSFDDRQELAAATTGTFGPGTHELTVVDVLGTVCLPPSSNGYDQRVKLIADDAAENGPFGDSVAVSESGETALIGAVYDDTDAGEASGSAYVFGRANGTWTQQTKLIADDAAEGDYFGRSVGVSDFGDTAVIAASGGAYVFERTDGAWTQRAKLTAPAGEPGITGRSIAVSESGETVVVGASGDGDGPHGYSSGSAYVFTRADGTWTHPTKLTAPDPENFEFFGWAAAVLDSGETVLIGAAGDEGHAGERTGAAYVFTRTDGTWSQQTKLTSPDAEPWDSLGSSIEVSGSGDTAIIGADGSISSVLPTGVDTPGSAYVFSRTDGTWTQQAKLTAADGAMRDKFGQAVAVSGSGEAAVIGALYDDTGAGYRSGSAYVFSRANGTWTHRTKLIADDAAEDDFFGSSVAVSGSGETTVISAPYDDTNAGENSGSAYVFGQ